MADRLDLHEELCDVLGSRNVYFQPPATVTMKYPCFVYERSSGLSPKADNKNYTYHQSYTITYISKDPDSLDLIRRFVLKFPQSRYNTHFTRDNLNHDTFSLYY